MEKQYFLNELEKRLSAMFSASKEGYKVAQVEKHRLEGFMQAGVFMGVSLQQGIFTPDGRNQPFNIRENHRGTENGEIVFLAR